MANKVNITKEGYNELLNKVLKNVEEERDLALDRYRLQDEKINDATDFVLQGKDIVTFLKVAADRTNTILAITKEIKEIVHADQLAKSSNSGIMDDNERKEMEEFVKQMKADKKEPEDFKQEDSETTTEEE